MDGLDVLINSQPTPPVNGLDVLLGKALPAPVAPKPGFAGSVPGAVVQGVNDVQNGAAQWLYNALPKGVQDAGDSVDHWLYDKTGGAIGTKPGLGFNAAVADQNRNYEGDRAANGRTGIDWARGAGAGGTQAALSVLMPQMGAIKAGAVGGALMPDTSNPASASDFALQKAKDMTAGGALGGAFGAAGNAVAGAIKPAVSAPAQRLLDSGVSLTPGQMLGGFAKSVEDKLTSVPIVGDAIKGAMARGTESLNTAAYQRVVKPLQSAGFDAPLPSGVGRDAVDQISTSVSNAYDSLIPKLRFKADPQFSSDLSRIQSMASQGLAAPQLARFQSIIDNNLTKNLTAEGRANGETLKGMLGDIGSQASGYIHDSSFENQQLGAALQSVQQSIKDSLTRTNPMYAKQLNSVNEAFANLTRVQSAAAMQGASNGVFSAAQLAAAVKGGDKTVRDNAYARGNALMQDLSDPAKALLSSSVPDSGTAGRVGLAAGAGALLTHPSMLAEPSVLGGIGAAMLPALAYTKPMLPMVQKALTMRPARAGLLSDAVRNGTQRATPGISGGLLQATGDPLNQINIWGAPQ